MLNILGTPAMLIQIGGQDSAFKQEPQGILIQAFQGPLLEKNKKKQKNSIMALFHKQRNGGSEKFLTQDNSFSHSVNKYLLWIQMFRHY